MSKTFEQGLDEVARLCEFFKINRTVFCGSGVKEAHVRQMLIDPFFEALGWDVRNVALVAPQYREVFTEDSLDVSGSQRRPDYTFRAAGSPRFFVEAKKCGVNLDKDPAPAYQLRCYGWSAKLPVSILTDFEEFAVYDCSIRPKPSDKSTNARINYLDFAEYPDRWREIWDVYSRSAVMAGAFDQYSLSKRGKRGSSEVDEEFLKEIENWRVELARNIALRNADISADDLNRAVQLIIDRIVFLRMAEDRGLEPYGQLLKLCDASDIYKKFAQKICRVADDKYNSGLFHFQKEDGVHEEPDRITPRLNVDDKVFKPILQKLYFEHGSQYQFTVIPVEMLGTVYERFLGKVIRLTKGHQAKVEEKPEVRKAGGVYYTPSYIVDYIVKNTVGKQIEGKSPAQLAAKGKDQHIFRVLDMACGSGSFLLGAYQYLLDHCLKWYIAHKPEKHPNAVRMMTRSVLPLSKGESEGVQTADVVLPLSKRESEGVQMANAVLPLSKGELEGVQMANAVLPLSKGELEGVSPQDWRLTIQEKKRILTTHIFGVDIDSQAVEVSKLSLLLKVLEGESDETVGETMRLWQERALPNLSDNIKCGNSLIGPDYFAGMLIPDPDDMKRVNPFDWKHEFPQAMGEGGFDCVIGNPPYGQLLPKEQLSYLCKPLPVFGSIPDVYVAFIEKSHDLALNGGRFGFIVPSAWLGGPVFRPLRELLLRYTIETLITLPFDVFKDAYIDTLVITVLRINPPEAHAVAVHEYGKRERLTQIDLTALPISRICQSRWSLTHDGKFIAHSGMLDVLERMREANPSVFGDFVLMKRGVLFDKGLLTNVRTGVNSHRYFEGDVYRYQLNFRAEHWIEFGPKMKEAPKEFSWFEGERILLRRLVNRQQRLMAVPISETVITNKNLYVLKPSASVPLLFALAVLNSRLISRLYLCQISQATKDDFPQITIRDILSLPFPAFYRFGDTGVSERDRCVLLAGSILSLRRAHSEAESQTEISVIERQIDATDREIDQLVYELYGLTEEEIRIVEGE